jgi:hypothetical protein
MEGCCRLIGFHHPSVLKELLVLIATKSKFNKSEIAILQIIYLGFVSWHPGLRIHEWLDADGIAVPGQPLDSGLPAWSSNREKSLKNEY